MSIRNDVLQLVFLTEKMEADLLKDHALSPEEALVVRGCASQLLTAIPDPALTPEHEHVGEH